MSKVGSYNHLGNRGLDKGQGLQVLSFQGGVVDQKSLEIGERLRQDGQQEMGRGQALDVANLRSLNIVRPKAPQKHKTFSLEALFAEGRIKLCQNISS